MTKARALRVAAGEWKGRALDVPRSARPTSGRARAALFSILHDSVVGAAVLDLYAGSGAVGIEAVSRGARRAVLVEADAGELQANAKRLDPEGARLSVVRAEAARAVALLARAAERFDLVFADPPYEDPFPQELLAAAAGLLAPGGLLVLQRDNPEALPVEPPGVALVERRRYGRNVFCFFTQAGSSLDFCAPEGF